jgi:hypothetical protein
VTPRSQDTVSVRGNVLRAESTGLGAARLDGLEHCLLAENQCFRTAPGVEDVVEVREAASAIASANRVRGGGEAKSGISIWLKAKSSAVTIVANLTQSTIQVNDNPVPSPWKEINVVAP